MGSKTRPLLAWWLGSLLLLSVVTGVAALIVLDRIRAGEAALRARFVQRSAGLEELRTGIYLGSGAERPAPARGNTIEDNEIGGYKMKDRCIGLAPGIAPGANTIRNNNCESSGPP